MSNEFKGVDSFYGQYDYQHKEISKEDLSQAVNQIRSRLKENADVSIFNQMAQQEEISKEDFSSALYSITSAEAGSLDEQIGILYDVLDIDGGGVTGNELARVFDSDDQPGLTNEEIMYALEVTPERIAAAQASFTDMLTDVPVENNILHAEVSAADKFNGIVTTLDESFQRHALLDLLEIDLDGFEASINASGGTFFHQTIGDFTTFFRVVRDDDGIKIIQTTRNDVSGSAETTIKQANQAYSESMLRAIDEAVE